jgi:hypothetical protein
MLGAKSSIQAAPALRKSEKVCLICLADFEQPRA